jgi:hypothetical protein
LVIVCACIVVPGARSAPKKILATNHIKPNVILALYNPKADGNLSEPRPNVEHIYFSVADIDDVHRRAERVGGYRRQSAMQI